MSLPRTGFAPPRAALLSLSLLLGACALDEPDTAPRLELRPAAAGTLVRQIASGADDVEEVASGYVYAQSRKLELVQTSRRGLQTVGLRFADVTVPPGATVTRAYLQFTAAEGASDSVRASVGALASDDAPRFSGRGRSLSAAAKTRRRVDWRVAPWAAGVSGEAQRTPDLSALVQEIVDRPGWRSGNALTLTVQGSRGTRGAVSYERSRRGAPVLHLEFETHGDAPKGGGKGRKDRRDDRGAGVPIIFDTDYGFDVDDVGALAVLHALADNGEADLLAVITTVTDPYAPRAMDAVNTFYGRPNLPLGQNTWAPASYRWDKAYPYWRRPSPRFVANLAHEFPNDAGSRVAPAVPLYRKTLAAQPDRSVTIVAVGFMKNLADLLESGPDGYSSLSGRELVARKVKQLVVMGGGYPDNEGDFNLTSGPGRDTSDAQLVMTAWPTEIVFTPGNVCGDVRSGQTLKNTRDNPVARAYEVFFGRSRMGRASWDLCAALYAVRGLRGPGGETFRLASDKRLTLHDSGRSAWVPGRSQHRRLVRAMPRARMEGLLNELLTQPPR